MLKIFKKIILASDLISFKFKYVYVFLLLVGPTKTILNAYSNTFVLNQKNQNGMYHPITHSNVSSQLASESTQSNGSIINHDNHHHEEHHHENSSNNLLYSILINIDPILSISLSFIYLLYFVYILISAGRILSQALPHYIDIDVFKKDMLQFVRVA